MSEMLKVLRITQLKPNEQNWNKIQKTKTVWFLEVSVIIDSLILIVT